MGGNVSVIDGETFEIAKVIDFDIPGVSPEQIQPLGMRFSVDGKKTYVAIGLANRVAVVNTDTFDEKDYVLEGQRPWHVDIAPNGSKPYVANDLTNDMTIIDLAALKPDKSIPVGGLP